MTENELDKSMHKLLESRIKVIKKIKQSLKNKVTNFPITKDEKNTFLKDIYHKIDQLNKKQIEDLKLRWESQKEYSKEVPSNPYHEVELSFLRDELFSNFRIDQRGLFQEAIDIINNYAPQYSNHLRDQMIGHYQEAFAPISYMPEEFALKITGRDWFTGFKLIYGS